VTTHRSAPVLRLLAASVAALALVFALTQGAAAARPVALAAATNCPPPKYPGTGYFSSLSVSGTSCSTGRKLVVSYYRCRLKHGAAGKCTGTVEGFTCSEKRESIPTEIDARVTCHRHKATVVHTYQQDL
jgi:hypothetical protein